MVLYFKARPDAGDYTIYMGADKNENEELIKYGLPEDVWYAAARCPSTPRPPLISPPGPLGRGELAIHAGVSAPHGPVGIWPLVRSRIALRAFYGACIGVGRQLQPTS